MAASAAAKELGATAAEAAVASQKGGVAQALEAVFAILEEAGWRGFMALLVGFSAWVCFSLPTTPIELAAGFVYGPVWGCVCGTICKTAGSCAALLLVRAVGQRYGWKLPGFFKDKIAALRNRPFLTMIGVRLAPIPLGVKNYGLALCEVGAAPYTGAALAVNMPFSMLWATAGASCRSLSEALSMDHAPSNGISRLLLGKVLPALAITFMLVGAAVRGLKPVTGTFPEEPDPWDAECKGKAT